MSVTRPSEWKGSDLRSRTEIVQYLRANGGEVTDQTGLVVGIMRQALGKGRALSQLLADMEADGMLEREVRGRRTFRITLKDDWNLVPKVSAVPDLPQSDASGPVDYEQLAQTLLAITLKRATTPPEVRVDQRAKEGLAQAELEILELRHVRDELQLKVTELEEQVRILTHNQGVLQSQLDRKPTKDGPTIAERLSEDEKRMLTELQSSLPER